MEKTEKDLDFGRIALLLKIGIAGAFIILAEDMLMGLGLSPLPRWCWVFSMPVGSLIFSLVGLFGNHGLVNALMVGAFSLGDIYSLAGHLFMLRKLRK